MRIVESTMTVNFGSVAELLDSLKKSKIEFQSIEAINCFFESGCSYLLMHQFVENGFNVFIVDGKAVKEFRGDREKTDAKDVAYIQELYHKSPELFKPLTETEKADVKIKFLMAKYNHFTKDLARFKNREKAYERQFGENEAYGKIISELETKKEASAKRSLALHKSGLGQNRHQRHRQNINRANRECRAPEAVCYFVALPRLLRIQWERCGD